MSAIKTMMKVGRIHYINAIPFFHRLEAAVEEGIEYYQNYPTKINLAMRHRQIQIAPISSLEYLNYQDQYYLLPDLAIGARDFSSSVLFFSHEKIEGLAGQKIALSRESLSSSILLKILLQFKYKFKNRFVLNSLDPAQMLEKHKAGLVIGDRALLYRPRAFIYKYDLSELWWNWTEKPFCFAVWAVQKKYADQNPAEVASFYRALIQNRDRNLMDIEGLIKETLDMNFLDANFSKIFGYLFNLNYGLDPAMLEGLQLYYRLAHRLGVSPKAKRIQFFDIKKAAC